MNKREPIWIGAELAQAIHHRQLSEHGGPEGVRDHTLLESALALPRQLFASAPAEAVLPSLAAAYAVAIARNHPFVDGNKRTAYVLCRTFLLLNGCDISGNLEERYLVFLGLASGELNEQQIAAWLRSCLRNARVNELRAGYQHAVRG